MSRKQDNNKVTPCGYPFMSKEQDNNKVTPCGYPFMSKEQDNNKVKKGQLVMAVSVEYVFKKYRDSGV
ncbi:hypothetical protein [Lacrimispora amygdalina]|uniref:hypothetical protein n=1 Tax=Lacrimispora amygdalina TaxID=253257 RepID=UPI000BE41976|nr:hypothetical protein [Lacrimispora amygdalina]